MTTDIREMMKKEQTILMNGKVYRTLSIEIKTNVDREIEAAVN